jgi:Flp pilus assembly protein TadB
MSKLYISKEELLNSFENIIKDTLERKQEYYITTAVTVVIAAIATLWLSLQIFLFCIVIFSIAIPVLLLDMFINKIRRILWEK